MAGEGLEVEGLASVVVSLQRREGLHHTAILTASQHTHTSLDTQEQGAHEVDCVYACVCVCGGGGGGGGEEESGRSRVLPSQEVSSGER